MYISSQFLNATAMDLNTRPEKETFSREEVVKFGNYLLSSERKARIKQSGNGRFKEVQHSDLENFEDILLNQKDVIS